MLVVWPNLTTPGASSFIGFWLRAPLFLGQGYVHGATSGQGQIPIMPAVHQFRIWWSLLVTFQNIPEQIVE